MELERARDYDVEVLCVRNLIDKKTLADRVSDMIKTCDFKIEPYRDPSELETIVKKFLP